MAKVLPPENALVFLKADLGFFDSTITPAMERYLAGLLFTAVERLSRRRVYLTAGKTDDDQFQAEFAAWLYRNRISGQAMPDSLKAEIRNRQVNMATSSDP